MANVDAATFIKQEIENKRAAEAAQAKAATLEERIKPVQNSVANKVIEFGLDVFSKIPNGNFNALTPSFNEGCQFTYLKLDESIFLGRRESLSLYPDGSITLETHLPGKMFAASEAYAWDLWKTTKTHFFKPNELALKDTDDQIKVAESVLTAIGNFAASGSQDFKLGFSSAMEYIRQSYDSFRANASDATNSAQQAVPSRTSKISQAEQTLKRNSIFTSSPA